MRYREQVALRPQRNIALQNASIKKGFIKFALLAVMALASPGPTLAGGSVGTAYVVGNDRGGFLRDRLIELSNLRASGRRVEIRGNICYSTCTMLLGLPKTCISPDTTFGFHGPSKLGRRLEPERFEHFSRVIAHYYPAALRSWYMSTGRNRIHGMHRIRGSEIIRMGIQACRTGQGRVIAKYTATTRLETFEFENRVQARQGQLMQVRREYDTCMRLRRAITANSGTTKINKR